MNLGGVQVTGRRNANKSFIFGSSSFHVYTLIHLYAQTGQNELQHAYKKHITVQRGLR
jgi:hypothetical protein